MTNEEFNYDEIAWQYALDKVNDQNKAAWTDTENPFVPVSIHNYVQTIIDSLGVNYGLARRQEHLDIIATQSDENVARLAKVSESSPEIKAALAAQVDALPNTSDSE